MAASKKQPAKEISFLDRALPWILVICGVIGIIMAAVLTYDHNKIAANPNYIPSCNLNPVIACGSVIASNQGHAFGIPNPWIGLAAFPVLVTTGVAILAGAKLKRWYWIGLELGTIFGLVFIHWLFFETVYRIHALCPYCIGTWIVTIAVFLAVTIYNFRHGYLKAPAALKPIGRFIDKHPLDVLLVWYLVIFVLILKHFWYYYGQHFFLK